VKSKDDCTLWFVVAIIVAGLMLWGNAVGGDQELDERASDCDPGVSYCQASTSP